MKKFKQIFLVLLSGSFLFSCGSKSHQEISDHGQISAQKNQSFFEQVGSVYSISPNSKYSEKLAKCIYVSSSENSCKISEVPLIGMNEKKVTVNDILERTFVSHGFLAIAFSDILIKLNPEILQMFGAVNAVVISDQINPSFYYRVNGTIYLSGRYFWKNLEEYKIVSKAKDKRDEYGNANADSSAPSSLFAFEFDSFYAKNSKYLNSRESKNIQTQEEMLPVVSRLLFHELTHANDYFSRVFYTENKFSDLDTYASVSYNQYTSNKKISSNIPSFSQSEVLSNVAGVLYFGIKAKSTELEYTADQVALEFQNDVATDLYAYSNEMEDLAMLAEESLMLFYYDYNHFVGIIKYPTTKFYPPENYLYPLVYGEKNRILNDKLKIRSKYVVSSILNKEIYTKYIEKIDSLKSTKLNRNAFWAELINL